MTTFACQLDFSLVYNRLSIRLSVPEIFEGLGIPSEVDGHRNATMAPKGLVLPDGSVSTFNLIVRNLQLKAYMYPFSQNETASSQVTA
jgi:hypothetical protein